MEAPVFAYSGEEVKSFWAFSLERRCNMPLGGFTRREEVICFWAASFGAKK